MFIYYKLSESKKTNFKLNKWKIKAIILSSVLIFYYFNSNIFILSSSVNDFSSINDLQSYVNYYSTFVPLDTKISLLSKYKKAIRKLILKKNVNKKIKNINSIYVDVNFRFGNLVAFLNKLLYYCEIVKCKFIILNEKKFWFINKKIKAL